MEPEDPEETKKFDMPVVEYVRLGFSETSVFTFLGHLCEEDIEDRYMMETVGEDTVQQIKDISGEMLTTTDERAAGGNFDVTFEVIYSTAVAFLSLYLCQQRNGTRPNGYFFELTEIADTVYVSLATRIRKKMVLDQVR